MNRPKRTLRRRFAIVVGGLALVSLIASALALRYSLLEQWYLNKLFSRNQLKKDVAIERLALFGGEESWRILTEQLLIEFPQLIMTERNIGALTISKPSEAPKNTRRLEPAVGRRPFTRIRSSQSSTDRPKRYSYTISEIQKRIGEKNTTSLVVEMLRDSQVDIRARLYLSQWILLLGARSEDLPETFRSFEEENPRRPVNYFFSDTEFVDLKRLCIRICIEAIDSDCLHARLGALFQLGVCRREARSAAPKLNSMLKDSNPEIRWAVTSALRRISGTSERLIPK